MSPPLRSAPPSPHPSALHAVGAGDRPQAVVVGAGIGGLAAATALTRIGVDCLVLERRPELQVASAGNGLVVWHNGTHALRVLGLAARLGQVGQELASYRFRSWRGPTLADWDLTDPADSRGAPAFAVSRPALHSLLREACGATVRLGAACIGLGRREQGDAGPRHVVHLADGSTVEADLVVGADGVRSTLRRGLLPHEPPPRFAGMRAYQGVVDVPEDISEHLVPAGSFLNTFGPGGFFVAFRLGDSRVYWDGVVSDRVLRRRAADATSPTDFLRSVFGGWDGPFAQLLDATPPGQVHTADIVDRDPVAWLPTDGLTLLGDAAHPMTFNLGQGANQALEDAVVLAHAIESTGDLAAGARAYERKRATRTAKVVRQSRFNGRLSRWTNPGACLMRDAFMRAAFPRLIRHKTYALTMGVDLPTLVGQPADSGGRQGQRAEALQQAPQDRSTA